MGCIERNCCACCMEMGSPPFIRLPEGMDARWAELPQAMKDHIAHIRDLQEWEDGVPCVWLNVATRKCVYYDLRPDICRGFKVDSTGCRANIEREFLREG